MKKIVTLTAALALSITAAQAQGGYFRIGLGYALPTAGQAIDPYTNTVYSGDVTVNEGDIIRFDVKKASLNSGFQGTVAGGFMFSRHVGAELGATIGISPREYESTTVNTFEDNGDIITQTTVNTFRAKTPVMLTPSLVVQSGGNKVNLYARGGIVLPLNAKMTTEGDYRLVGPGFTYTEVYNYETRMKFAPGFSGAMGLKGYITRNIAVWGEACLTSLSLNVTEVELTEAVVNGTNVLSQINDPLDEFDTEGSASKAISYQIPFSNMAINAGISLEF